MCELPLRKIVCLAGLSALLCTHKRQEVCAKTAQHLKEEHHQESTTKFFKGKSTLHHTMTKALVELLVIRQITKGT
jgi:hypothetical protein